VQTGTLDIRAIFGQDRRLLVPLFQRPYVWRKEQQWEPLWEDIRTVAERILADKPAVRPHFLGAMVLELVPQPMGHLECRTIVDGQQRLTTVQIILEAFADICASLGEDKYHRALLKLTRNDDPLSDQPDDQFKVWPTNVDQEQFRLVMGAGSPAELATQTLQPPHLIADAYVYFHQALLEWLAPTESVFEARLEALYNALREYVRMVVIGLESEDDAQLIFETLNARGTPLLPSDLVKNYLLRRAALQGEKLEALYERYWRPFDANPNYWRAELGPGHAKRARIDLYLQYFLTLKRGDEVQVGHLYTSFRDYANNGERASKHLESLQRYAQVYQSFDAMDRGTREGLFFRRLGQMDITTAHPFLLELFARYGPENPQVGEVLADIESFLVRRMVCQLSTRGYNRLFIELLKTLDDPPEDVAARVRAALLGSDAESARWPRDPEFREAWLEAPLYRVLRRDRVRMLLEALNRQLQTDLTEKIDLPDGLTIEHLLPQDWRRSWPLPTDIPADLAEARRVTTLHTIGNLTLVRKKLNSKVSNGPWADKVKVILEHSALNLNRKLADYPEWGESAIVRRSQMLYEAARRIWRHPKDL